MMLVPRRNNGLSLWDSMFDDSFFGGFKNEIMKTDIEEKKDSYLMKIDLPGFEKEDLKLELKNGYLTVSANRNEEKNEEDEKGNLIHRERYYGSASRSFYVGEGIKEEDIKAKYKHGILQLSFPKTDKTAGDEKRYIEIE